MKIDTELLDVTVLLEGFNLSKLWAFYEEINFLKTELDRLKQQAILLGKHKDLIDIETQLYFVNRNTHLIEEIMEIKELDIFSVTEYGDICLN